MALLDEVDPESYDADADSAASLESQSSLYLPLGISFVAKANADSEFPDDGLDAANNTPIPSSVSESDEADSVKMGKNMTDAHAHADSAATAAPVQISQPNPHLPDATVDLAAQTARVAEILSKLAQGLEDSKVVDRLASINASDISKDELDPPGEEMGPNAKIWDIYLDEAKHYDDTMLDAWNKGLDVILVFAGLFSAILTTFLVQASTLLSPDPSIATNTLLNEIIFLLNSTAERSSFVALTTFTTSPSARWVNGLWFSSLALTLSSALLSIMAKQWLQAYQPMKRGDIPRENARRRQRLFMSFKSWHVGAIIDTTPIIIHISLLLFFAGLVVFVGTLDSVIAMVTVIIISSASMFYGSTLLLPALFVGCPYKTPALDHGKALIHAFLCLTSICLRLPRRLRRKPPLFGSWRWEHRLWELQKIILLPLGILLGLGQTLRSLFQSFRAVTVAFRSRIWPLSFNNDSKATTETRRRQEEDLLDIEVIAWLARGSTSTAVHKALFYTMAGLPNPKTQHQREILTEFGLFSQISRVCETRELHQLALKDPRFTDLHYRALFKTSLWHSTGSASPEITTLLRPYLKIGDFDKEKLEDVDLMSTHPMSSRHDSLGRALLSLTNWHSDDDKQVSLKYSFVLLSGFFLSHNCAWTFKPSSSISNVSAESILDHILGIECQYATDLKWHSVFGDLLWRSAPDCAPGHTALYVSAAHTLYCALRIQSDKYPGIHSHFHPGLLDEYLLLSCTALIRPGSVWLPCLRRKDRLSMIVHVLGRVIVPLFAQEEEKFLLIPDTSALTFAIDALGKITEDCMANASLSEYALASLRQMWYHLISPGDRDGSLKHSMLMKFTTELPLLRAVLHLFVSNFDRMQRKLLYIICDSMFDFERGMLLYPFFAASGVGLIFGVITQSGIEEEPSSGSGLSWAIGILALYAKKLRVISTLSLYNLNSSGRSHVQLQRQVDALFQCGILEHFSRTSRRYNRIWDAHWPITYLQEWLTLLQAMHQLRRDHRSWNDVLAALKIVPIVTSDDDYDYQKAVKRRQVYTQWRDLRKMLEQRQTNSQAQIHDRNLPAPHIAVDMSLRVSG